MTTATPLEPTRPRTLSDELDDLHATYAYSINVALEVGDLAAADDLAHGYDDEAWELVAAWEGKTHLLRELRRPARESALRRAVRHVDEYTRWAFNPQPPLTAAGRARRG